MIRPELRLKAGARKFDPKTYFEPPRREKGIISLIKKPFSYKRDETSMVKSWAEGPCYHLIKQYITEDILQLRRPDSNCNISRQ